jgi:hypothetical protein
MNYEFEKVLNGIAKYINNEIYPGMNQLQKFAARVVVGRILNNEKNIKNMIVNNGFIKTFGIVDEKGMIELESLMHDIKREIAREEKITFDVPMFGKMTFSPEDVDALYYTITGEELEDREDY